MHAVEESRAISFPSKLGWMVLFTNGQSIRRLEFGLSSQSEAIKHIARTGAEKCDPRANEKRWIALLRVYAAGKSMDLSELPVDESSMSRFAQKVRRRCREIKPGQVKTYGDLAVLAGSPRAARAVGSVMRRNPTPLIVPCHRVVAVGGLGGYSGSEGLKRKTQLLKMEGCSI